MCDETNNGCVGDYKDRSLVNGTEHNICSFAEDAAEVLDEIRSNSQRVFNTTENHQQRKFENLLRMKQASVSPTSFVDKTKWVINLRSRGVPTEEKTELCRDSCERPSHRDYRHG